MADELSEEAIAPEEALDLLLKAKEADRPDLEKVRRYVKGEHDAPYTPKNVKQEYKGLIIKSVANWLPLIPTVVGQNLFLEGYRNASEAASAEADPTTDGTSPSEMAWQAWLANGMDARQSAVHKGALTYGYHFVLVLQGTPEPTNPEGLPVIKPISALNMTAVYGDDDDWPLVAMHWRRARFEGKLVRMLDVYDETNVTTYVGKLDAKEAKDFQEIGSAAHGMGVCPVVRFRNEWEDSDEEPIRGEIWPYIPIQDRLNETTLDLLMAQQYGAFIQKWVTGLAVEEDGREFLSEGVPNPNFGKVIEPFKVAVDRLIVAEDPDTKFGSFAATDLHGYLESLEAGIRHLSALAQIPPHYLLGAVANLSAEALAAAEAGLSRKVSDRKSLFGVAWAQVLRLTCTAQGTDPDLTATVVWRDTESRALASTVDAFGKLAQMLGVPPEALWEKLPGFSVREVREWKAMAALRREQDPMNQLASTLTEGAGALADTMPVDEAA